MQSGAVGRIPGIPPPTQTLALASQPPSAAPAKRRASIRHHQQSPLIWRSLECSWQKPSRSSKPAQLYVGITRNAEQPIKQRVPGVTVHGTVQTAPASAARRAQIHRPYVFLRACGRVACVAAAEKQLQYFLGGTP